MADLSRLMEPRGDWRFLTAPDEAAIAPVLRDFDQDVLREASLGGDSPAFSHLLRVFMVDDQRRVRNIYSASFMDWRVVLNDVRTLAADSGS